METCADRAGPAEEGKWAGDATKPRGVIGSMRESSEKQLDQ